MLAIATRRHMGQEAIDIQGWATRILSTPHVFVEWTGRTVAIKGPYSGKLRSGPIRSVNP